MHQSVEWKTMGLLSVRNGKSHREILCDDGQDNINNIIIDYRHRYQHYLLRTMMKRLRKNIIFPHIIPRRHTMDIDTYRRHTSDIIKSPGSLRTQKNNNARCTLPIKIRAGAKNNPRCLHNCIIAHILILPDIMAICCKHTVGAKLNTKLATATPTAGGCLLSIFRRKSKKCHNHFLHVITK